MNKGAGMSYAANLFFRRGLGRAMQQICSWGGGWGELCSKSVRQEGAGESYAANLFVRKGLWKAMKQICSSGGWVPIGFLSFPSIFSAS